MEALKLQPHEFRFTNLLDLENEISNRYSKNAGFGRFCDLREWIIANEELIKSKKWLGALKTNELKKRYFNRDGYKKPELVKLSYALILQNFNILPKEQRDAIKAQLDLTGLTTMEQRVLAGIIATSRAVTVATYENIRDTELKKEAALNKALTNPETLDEFRTFLEYNKNDFRKLTGTQLEAYDKFITDLGREQRKKENKRNKIIDGIDLGDAQMEILKSWHTKREKDIWVVRLDQWIRTSLFDRLLAKAKEYFHGYWSGYKENGAIPGFIFQNEENARLFMQLTEGEVDTSSIFENLLARQLENRVESLREKAERLIERGEEEYYRERKTNTHRRAGMASNAEAAAARQIIWGKILYAIADRQENGSIEYLDRVSFILDVETLDWLLSRAKWNMINEEKIAYPDQAALSLSTDWARYVKFPYPTLYIENCKQTVLKARREPGKIMAADRFVKRFNEALKKGEHTFECKSEREIEDFAKVFVSDEPYCTYTEQLRIYNRITRMNLQTVEEQRTAMREYIRIKLTANLSPEQQRLDQLREMVRAFIGLNIPGFFPMTREMALSVIEKADIQPGDSILEPSAGLGDLADVIAELHPENELRCTEIRPDLSKVIEFKGHAITCGDFLQDKPEQPMYDRILMNPPFEELEDIDHVLHAFNYHLTTGGVLVAVMANNKTWKEEEECKTEREKKIHRFLKFVKAHGYSEKNPENAFATAFRPTGVSTITVVLYK